MDEELILKKWDYKPWEPPRPYVVTKDYGEVIMTSPVYTDNEGNLYIDKSAIDTLPSDVSPNDLDATWIRVIYEKKTQDKAS